MRFEMSKIRLFALLIFPLVIQGQEPGPMYKNDTLYTTCGYRIFPGQVLHFGKGVGKKGQYRYIRIKNGINPGSLAKSHIVVKTITQTRLSTIEVSSAVLTGTIIFHDGTSGYIEFYMEFDRAVENPKNGSGELTVPQELQNCPRIHLRNQLNALLEIYGRGALTQEEYETRKKKLLEQW